MKLFRSIVQEVNYICKRKVITLVVEAVFGIYLLCIDDREALCGDLRPNKYEE